MIRHDLSCGLFARYRWALVPAGIFLLGAWLCARTLTVAEMEGTFVCVLFYLFVGKAPSHLFAAGEMLSTPFLWLFLQVGCLLYTVEYPTRDLGQYGLQVLIHCGCRKVWWYSKCLWCFLSVLAFWGIGALAVVGYCVFTGVPISLSLPDEVVSLLMAGGKAASYGVSLTCRELLLHLVIMPLMTMFTLNMLQMTIAIVNRRAFLGLLSASAVLIWSAFLCTPLAIGNYGMLYRDNLFWSNGLSYKSGFWVLTIVNIFLILFGRICFQRSDLLGVQATEGNDGN